MLPLLFGSSIKPSLYLRFNKKSKVVYFNANEDKVITGCSAGAEGVLRATNKLKKKLFSPLKNKEISDFSGKEIKS